MNQINERIIPLDEMDRFEVAEGDPDVRGWQVFSSDGVKIGEVDELLVDTEALKVRYLDVELDDSLNGDEMADRHILIPIGYARLDERDDHILVDALHSGTLGEMPSYAQEPLTRDLEAAVIERFAPGAVKSRQEDDLYAGHVYDADRFYGSRRKNAS